MILRYNKPALEQILADVTSTWFPRENHTWKRFEVYNGKPEPDSYQVKCKETLEGARKEFLKKVHTMNGNISRVKLHAEYGCLNIIIGHPKDQPETRVMKIAYEGNVISMAFSEMLKKEAEVMAQYKL